MSKQIPSTPGPTLAINAKLLICALCAWASFSFWSLSPGWWGLGLLSICLGLASIISFAGAVKVMFQVQKREQAIREYLAQGSGPKSAEIANYENLRRAGMR